MENLDRLCAEFGYKYAKDVTNAINKDADKAENLITKVLGVLQEQGLYAFVLFCKSRSDTEKKGAVIIEKITKELFKDELHLMGNSDLMEEIRKDDGLASDLENLILAIKVLEKSLIYARYHAKAMSSP